MNEIDETPDRPRRPERPSESPLSGPGPYDSDVENLSGHPEQPASPDDPTGALRRELMSAYGLEEPPLAQRVDATPNTPAGPDSFVTDAARPSRIDPTPDQYRPIGARTPDQQGATGAGYGDHP